MPKPKQIEFTPEFEKILTEAKEPRGVVLGRQPLRTVIQNSNANKKAEFLKILDRVPELGKLSINDFMAEDKTKQSMNLLTQAMKEDKISKGDLKTFRGPMKNLLEQMGITAQGTTNPFTAQMKKVIAPAELKNLDAIETGDTRLIPTKFSIKTYEAIKDVGATLKEIDPNVHLQYVLHLLGGYRPSDFKNLRLENIDFSTGLVSNLDLKTDDNVAIKLAYFPQPQLDAIKSYLLSQGYQFDEERGKVKGKGLLFKNYKSNSETINAELKKTGVKNEYYQEVSKGIITKNLTVYDFRRLKETHLTNKGLLPGDPRRSTLTWRAPQGTVEKYTAGADIGGELEDYNAKSNATLVLLGNQTGGSLTLAQYMSEIGVDAENIGGYTKRLKVLQSDLIRLPPDKLNFAEKTIGPLLTTLPKDEFALSMEATEIDKNAADNFKKLAATNLETRQVEADTRLGKALQQKAQDIDKTRAAKEQLEQATAEDKKKKKQDKVNSGKLLLNEMLEDSLTSAKKIYDKAGNIISDNSGKLGILLTGLGVTGMADEFVADFLKYKSRGRSDVVAGIGASAETLRDVGIDVATGLNVPRNVAQMSLSMISPAGEGTDVVRETGRTQAGRQIPQRQISMESESANFLNQIQSNLQSEGTSETQALDIIEQDTNIGNKIGTFGRTPDVSPGFVTPPSKSDLADETKRQQNFLGVT
jgi:integrase